MQKSNNQTYIHLYIARLDFPLSNLQDVRMQKSNNQTYIHLYIDFPFHKYICDRSLSGDLFHIVNPFLSAKGLSSVIQHTFPTKSQLDSPSV